MPRSARAIAYHKYLQTEHWRNLRGRAIQRSNHRCALTGEKLRPREINVHHLAYAEEGFEATVVEDLCILSRLSHLLIHDFQRRGFIEAFNWQGLYKARQLYANGVGDPAILRQIRTRLKRKAKLEAKDSRWQPMRSGLIVKLPKKKNTERIGRGFPRPRVKWSTITEQERHALALRRQHGL